VIADFHIHYPMHVVPQFGERPTDLLGSPAARARMLDRVRAGVVHTVGRLANYRSFGSGPRVTVPRMHAGGVGVGLSVLYSFWDEMDWTRGANTPPDDRYFSRLVRQLEAVESELAADFADEAVLARTPAEMDSGIEARKTVLVHCVEGAYHLGRDPEKIALGVRELAERGVAYITVAHLFNRGVAEVVNALPFMPQPLWKLLFSQPRAPLLEPGKAAIRAMVAERVLIDVCHMTEHAVDATLSLLDRIDPRGEVPLVATHTGYRFGHDEYNLADRHVRAIADRGGVIGLIFAEHQALDGLPMGHTRTIDESIDVLGRHIDRLHDLTGSYDHIAIGSDLDGFIKPTLSGLGDAAEMSALERALSERYGPDAAGKIASGNLLRLLRSYWRS
jgi:microsomal dipeptidase-like Zn-dependent dipeptidase